MSGLTCEDARNLFDAHLNGELRPGLETELNAHRLRCPACRHELALLEVAGEVITNDRGGPALDDEFTSRLLACVCERHSSRRSRRRKLIRIGLPTLAAAACVVLVVGHFGRPKKDVAGWHSRPPAVAADNVEEHRAPLAEDEEPVALRAAFQAQVERALTEWRNDALSLQKIYHFITPQIHEEIRLEQPESVDDLPDLFEPGQSDTSPGGAAVSGQNLEDI